jgi:hypothetical protein
MTPTVEQETAMWTCPAEADIALPIGQLGGGALSQPSSPPG